MADVATPNPPSLSEDYLLPAEEKTEPVSNVTEVEKTVQETTPSEEESASENTSSDASEESSESPVDAVEKSEEPATEEEEEAKEDDAAEEEEATEDEAPEIKLETAPADFRFPTTNQTRHCFTRYVEFHKCTAAKGEGAPECDKFAKFYRSLCPGEWLDNFRVQDTGGLFKIYE
ncbi:hypothetical protein V2J09_013858 [Rumex salicifolius]